MSREVSRALLDCRAMMYDKMKDVSDELEKPGNVNVEFANTELSEDLRRLHSVTLSLPILSSILNAGRYPASSATSLRTAGLVEESYLLCRIKAIVPS